LPNISFLGPKIYKLLQNSLCVPTSGTLKVATHGPVGLSVIPAQTAGDRSAVAFVGSGRLNSYTCTGRRRKYENSFVHPADRGTAQAYRNVYGSGRPAKLPDGLILFHSPRVYTTLHIALLCTFCEVLSLKKCLERKNLSGLKILLIFIEANIVCGK